MHSPLPCLQGVLDHDKDGQPIDRNEDNPLNPDHFPLESLELWPEIHQDDAQPIERMEEHKEVDEDLEINGLVDGVDKGGDIAADLLHKE